ncbi:MAG: hypothetical protein QF464_18970, partial [Myxococcota bacterium]|nr:hypothetical protein [Myxococcota bacterium]
MPSLIVRGVLTSALNALLRAPLVIGLAVALSIVTAGCTSAGGADTDATADGGDSPTGAPSDGSSDVPGAGDEDGANGSTTGAGPDASDGGDASVVGPPTDAVGPPAVVCEPQSELVIEPLWMAGGSGSRDELGMFGKPDAIFLDDSGVLFAGDESSSVEELHLYDIDTDDPTVLSDWIAPLADFGADPGPAGTGELEFEGISGITRNRVTGQLYIVEQDNGRVQILLPGPDGFREAPHLVHEQFFGAFAPNKDLPGDGQFVRLQAARADSLGRLFLSDDAKKNATTARRDVQVFSADLEYLGRFGGLSYGSLGEDGNLEEPENFVIDEGRDRIYV